MNSDLDWMGDRKVRCPNCDKEITDARQKFCGACGAPLSFHESEDDKMRKRILDEAWEAGKEHGRKEEREREANEAKTYLWAAIVLGAIGGGVIGGGIEGPPERRIGRVFVGVIIGGLIGGLHHIFGCFLTLVIFIVGAVAIGACLAM